MKSNESRFKPHLFRYRWGGDKWTMTVMATSEFEARQRLEVASRSEFIGIDVEKVPVFSGASWLVRLMVWWRNL